MVPQQARLACHRGCGHLLVRSVPGLATRLGRRFPFVAALPAGEDHEPRAVREVVEACVLQLALAANGVEPEVHDVTELGLHALRVVTQEHVRRPARAANEHRLAVDDELAIALPGEVGADAAYAEGRAGLIADRTINGSCHLQIVERMLAHTDRPPDVRMVEVEAWIALGSKRHGLRLTGSELNRSSQ